jgi:photosystem II stability/assembly factor-like uncharacterized protein
MSDLSEQLVALIDDCAPEVSVDEVLGRSSAEISVNGGSAHPHRRPVLIALSAAAILIVGVTAFLSVSVLGGHDRARAEHRAVRLSPGRWRLTASLSGSEFSLGTGVPNAITGADCSGDPTCFLATIYGLGGATATVTGSTYVSHDAGHAWEPTVLPANVATTTLVTCVTPHWCAAGGGLADPKTGDPAAKKVMRDPELLTTDDAGKHWEMHAVPLPVDVQQLPAYGSLPAETTYWPGTVDAITCSAPGTCNVVGHALSDRPGVIIPDEIVFLSTKDGGTHWTKTVLPESSSIADGEVLSSSSAGASMACPTQSHCVVAVTLGGLGQPTEYFWTTNNGGQTWQQSQLAGVASLGANVVCTSASVCWSGPAESSSPGSPGTILHSGNGGVTWSSVPWPAESPVTHQSVNWSSLGCSSYGTCFLGGYGLIDETTDSGKSWQSMTVPPGVGSINSMTCAPTGACVAVASPAAGNPLGQNGGSMVLTNQPSNGRDPSA